MNVAPPIPEHLWEQIPPAAREAILIAFAAMAQRIVALEATVRELEARLNSNSTNSHKPPSTDPPRVVRRPPDPPQKAKRRRGGQPGHKRHLRPLVPPDKLAGAVECLPAACSRCDAKLQGADPDPIRHQVADIPPIEPIVVEYRLHRLTCSCCGKVTRGTLPPGIPSGAFAPRLQALLSLLSGAYRLSKRAIRALVADVLGLHISTGSICNLERRGALALQPADAEARDVVKQADVANVDETSWRVGKERAWLWVAVTAAVTVFLIHPRRGAKGWRALLGESPRMVVITDRFPGYHPLSLRQFCWSHLQRDFRAMVDRRCGGEEVGEKLLIHCEKVFRWWRDFEGGRLARSSLEGYVSSLRGVVRGTLEAGTRCSCAKTAVVCSNLLEGEPMLWAFAKHCGVPPHNNAAERALRHAVIWRKTSFGTDSKRGSQFVERLLTVVETCRRRGTNVLEFLTGCYQAKLKGEAGPSLLA